MSVNSVNAEQLAALIRERGVQRVANHVRDAGVVWALAEGIDLTGWQVSQVAGAIAFSHTWPPESGAKPDALILCVNAPRAERARWQTLVDEDPGASCILLMAPGGWVA
jgi:hypothetical protein